MHPNPAFRSEPDFLNVTMCRRRGFGTLCISADPVPLASHVPFILDDAGKVAEMHLVRSNPIVRAVTAPHPAMITVNGPDGYVSPDWYDTPDQVPTWNYIAVHLRGRLERRPQAEMHALLDAQSAHFEAMLDPKPRWTTAKMGAEVLERMMRQIVPYTFHVTDVQGTWKLSQNKPDDVRLRAAEQVEAFGIGTDTRLLAALMRGA